MACCRKSFEKDERLLLAVISFTLAVISLRRGTISVAIFYCVLVDRASERLNAASMQTMSR